MLFAAFMLIISIFTVPVSAASAAEDDELSSGKPSKNPTTPTEHIIRDENGYIILKVKDAERANEPGCGELTINDFDAYVKDKLKWYSRATYTVAKWKFVGPIGVLSFCEPLFDSSSIVSTLESAHGNKITVYTYVEKISEALLVIGKLFCFLYFLLELMDHATRDSFTLETFIKSFAKLVILFVIFDTNTIKAIGEFAGGIEDKILDLVSTGATQAAYVELATFINTLENVNWLKGVFLIFENGIFSLTSLISILVVMFVAAGRLIEILVYQAFLPLGMSSIYNGGLSSSGFRYLKKYIALYVQGAIMFAAMILGHVLATAIGSGLGDIMDIVFSLATAMIIARSKNIANDIMGV